MRWFFPSLPLDVDRHFPVPGMLSSRTDWYALPSDPRCGIKLREGRMEIKLRLSSMGTRTLGTLCGELESWHKWGLEFAPGEFPTEQNLQLSGWLAVRKQRYLQHFSVAGAEVREINTRPDNGCEFELTQLDINGESWWTVGFEAVGQANQLETNLAHVARTVLQRGGFLQRFAPENSLGYARWLGRFA
jgi:hypothetical protein